ncbi:MFS transporter [Paenisporosarcina antarctica]|uniref:MFS transporter n=1 Tax=Paenisporosarcina antarctica TaxID=417367 RepID=A0A4P6ZZ68_9BACL|nr:MFS transporter [Paenisporosarcina antarctica]QBP41861.1 MFS transporter [Paenisporosarcina antarctica]
MKRADKILNFFGNNHTVPLKSTFYYGWYIVFIGSLGAFFSGPGQTYFISVFIDQYIRDFDWSRSQVSTIYSAATLVSAVCMFFMGRLIDKFGQRNMMVIVSIMLALACFFNSTVNNLIMLFFGILMLRLFGQGSMTLIPNTLIPQWFMTKRGRALSYMAIGGFASSAIFPPLNVWLVSAIGWENTWILWGVTILIVFTPLAYFLVRNTPEQVGLEPDGYITPIRSKAQENDPSFTKKVESDWTFKEAIRTKAFWFILSCVGIPALVNTAITFHLISIFNQNDLGAGVAALVLAGMALVGFPVTLVAGRLLDRVKVNIILAGIFVLEIVLLMMLQITNTIFMAVLFALVWGISNGFERIALSYVWPSYFGRAALGSIQGLATSVMVFGSAIGPLPFGIAFDIFGGYKEIIWISLIFPIIGIISSLLAKQPEKKKVV